MRESSSLPGRARWSRAGINLTDLRDVANELARPLYLPPISQQTLFLRPGESQNSHLRRVQSLLAHSLKEGFPPILSVRRYVKRNDQWTSVQAHFVTVTSVPGSLSSGLSSFPIRCVDSWGGRFRGGHISISERPFLGENANENPNLAAILPDVSIGKNLIRAGEESILVASAALGRF